MAETNTLSDHGYLKHVEASHPNHGLITSATVGSKHKNLGIFPRLKLDPVSNCYVHSKSAAADNIHKFSAVSNFSQIHSKVAAADNIQQASAVSKFSQGHSKIAAADNIQKVSAVSNLSQVRSKGVVADTIPDFSMAIQNNQANKWVHPPLAQRYA